MTVENQVSFQPNPNFISALTEDLKTNYLAKCKNAEQLVGEYNRFLENTIQRMVYFGQEWTKIHANNIETEVENEKLRVEISVLKISSHVNSNDKPASEILGASPNCVVKKSRLSNLEKFNTQINNNSVIAEKENIDELNQFFSKDFFHSDDDDLGKHQTPTKSAVSTPVEIHNSPILSKRKNVFKRSNSVSPDTSLHSISSHDSKIISSGTSLLEKISEIKCINNEVELQSVIKPFKNLESDSPNVPSNKSKEKGYNVLGVSKTVCGRTEFYEKGKKLKQTTLILKKIPPVVDLSKTELYDTCNSETRHESQVNSMWTESFYKRQVLNRNLNESCYKHKNEMKDNDLNDSDIVELNEPRKNEISVKISPAQNEQLTLKSNLLKKSETIQIRVKDPSKINDDALSNLKSKTLDDLRQYNCKRKKNNERCENDFQQSESIKLALSGKPENSNLEVTTRNLKTLKPEKNVITDETFFSPAECVAVKNNTNNVDDVNLTNFQDEIDCITPPAKRKHLNSFDLLSERDEESPIFAYKETPVRSKSDRAQLPGWDCRDCEKWYGHLPDEERKKRKNMCSKHRGKFKSDLLTPESFWNPVFNDTADSSND